MHIHCDKHVGMNGDCATHEVCNHHGQHYWVATYQPTHMFGSEVCAAPIHGYGATKELAEQRLEKAVKEFNDSLWL